MALPRLQERLARLEREVAELRMALKTPTGVGEPATLGAPTSAPRRPCPINLEGWS